MGKIVQVKTRTDQVHLPPLNLPYLAGEVTTLTDREYSGLATSAKNAITVIQSGVADPVRSSASTSPSTASDAYKLAKLYTNEAIRALTTLGLNPPAEMATDTDVANALNTAKAYTDTAKSTLNTAINAEKTARQSADTALNSAITDQVAAAVTSAINALNLGSAANHDEGDFDAAGAAQTVQNMLSSYVTSTALSAANYASITAVNNAIGTALSTLDAPTSAQVTNAINAAINNLGLGSASTHAATDFATPASVTAAISNLGLGSASTHAATDFDPAGSAQAVEDQLADYATIEDLSGVGGGGGPITASQITDSTVTGRTLVTAADAAAARTAIGADTPASRDAAIAAVTPASIGAQPVNSSLSSISSLPTTGFGRGLLVVPDAAGLRAAAALGDAATHSASDFATPASVTSAVAGLVNSAPSTLDTLSELATALGSDPNFASTTATALGNRLRIDATQSLSDTQKAQGQTNIGTARMVTAEQFGTTGTANDTSVFQAAVDYCTTQGGGTVWMTKASYNIGGLIMKSNVTLRSATRTMIYAPTGFTGWMIDTPATPSQSNIHLRDFTIYGGVTSGASPNTGGIRFQLTASSSVEYVGVSGTSLGCFKQVAGQATQLNSCGFLNVFAYRTLTQVEGTVYLGGTDHTVKACECNGGDFTSVQYPSTFYRCGLVIAGGTTWVYDSNGEYADVGIRVTGSANRFIGSRGDVNAGRGIMVDGLSNTFTNTMVGSNSLASPGTYDAIYLSAGAYGTTFDGVSEFADFTGAGVVHQHLVNDQVDIFGAPTLSESLPTIQNVVDAKNFYYRRINQKYVSRAIYPSATGNPIARQPSRYCAGNSFYDVTNNKPTFSDGTNWRDSGGEIVGNLLSPRVSLLNDTASLGWTAYGGALGTGSALGVSGWTKFGRARAMEITANGAGTVCGAQMAASTDGVVAGQSYSVMAYHLGVSQLASLFFYVVWYDASLAPIGGPVTTSSSSQTSVNTAQLYRVTGLVAPTGAVKATLFSIFSRVGMASNEKYQISKICLVPGAPTDYVEP